MCIACIELAKEKLIPKEFIMNFSELFNNILEDEKHLQELTNIVDNLSDDYKKQIEDYSLQEIKNE